MVGPVPLSEGPTIRPERVGCFPQRRLGPIERGPIRYASVNAARLIRPISAGSIVAARRVTQDHARLFCTVKAGTARGFCENLTTNFASRPDRASGALSGKTGRTKKRNEGLSIGP